MLGLISTPGQIWLSIAPVDLRRGIDGLSALVQQTLGQQPCAGSAFVFRNAVGNRIKVLLWDGNGVWLCQRRLHQGHFIWPKPDECRFSVTQAQWEWLIAGVDSHRAILPDALRVNANPLQADLWQRLSAQPPIHLEA
ncbi:MAG: IS66 family insertion sequence element accessory protein TnpB [Rhodospirillaceae bacterium]